MAFPFRRRRAPQNSSRVHLRREVRRFARGTRPGMLVLDAGAGRSPYRRLFSHARYEASDFAQLGARYAPLDYVCDITDIPVEDGRFDRIAFTTSWSTCPTRSPRCASCTACSSREAGCSARCSSSSPSTSSPTTTTASPSSACAGSSRRRVSRSPGSPGWRVTSGPCRTSSPTWASTFPGRAPRCMSGGWRGLRGRALLAVLRTAAPWVARELAVLDAAPRPTDTGMPKDYVVVARKPE